MKFHVASHVSVISPLAEKAQHIENGKAETATRHP